MPSINNEHSSHIMTGSSSAVPKVEQTAVAQVKHITDKRAEFKTLLIESKRSGGFPNATSQQTEMLRQLHIFLEWLDEEIQMTPDIKRTTAVEPFLKALAEPRNKIPPLIAGNAISLLAKWNGENWGEQAGPASPQKRSSDDEDNNSGSNSIRKKSRASTSNGRDNLKTLYLPPEDDKVWGRDGVMHGLALNIGGGRTSRVGDPRYPPRDAKQYGQNGFTNGDWFPFQLAAWFRGMHGTSQAGICGDAQMGAYSIVVAGGYEEFDRDEGNSLWYCGPGSNKNTDPRLPAKSAMTQALYASRDNGRDVRALRSSNGESAWAPSEGIRYDGLYSVVSAGTTTNKLGGRVERFKLVRKEGQPAIDTSRPTPAERNLLAQIRQTSPRGWIQHE